MKVTPLGLAEVRLIEPNIFEDGRGLFCEAFSFERYKDHGIPCDFVQDNLSFSRAGVLRGLHYQLYLEQAKLVTVLRGRVFDVAVDIRRDSPTFGLFASCELSASHLAQVFIPQGFAHGFLALEDSTVFYKCSALYSPSHDRGVAWDDPDLGIVWPNVPSIVSEKDRQHPRLREVALSELPVMTRRAP